jgi:hypothetical protein
MKFMLFINLGPKARDFKSLTDDERRSIANGYRAFNEIPGVTPGNQLQPPEAAKTVRQHDGERRTTDGPLVGTNDAIDGYCMVDADDLDAAIEIATRLPGLDLGGAVEIRPFVER